MVCEITLPQAVMWTTPEKHTKRRKTLGNANQNKTTRAGYKKVYGKKNIPKEAFRIKGALWNTGQNKNTNNNSETEEGQKKALKWSIQTGKEPYKNYSEKNRALQNAKKNNKTTQKKSSDRRRPS